jgi:hypothetical protein
MMHHRKILTALTISLGCLFLGLLTVFCQAKEPVSAKGTGSHSKSVPATLPSDKEKFYIFLLIGQSNMAGRGVIDPEDKVENPRILSLNKKNEWVIAKDPLHFDKPSVVGVGPGLSFARALLDTLPDDVKIGLVPCACGGSPMRVWAPQQYWSQTSSYPYDDAVARTKVALRHGTLKGILWHQGSADKKNALQYPALLSQLVTALRAEFQAPEVPFVAGEIGRFHNNCAAINRAFHEAKSIIPAYDVVSSEGLTPGGDSTHFDTPSQLILGRRYAAKMKQMLYLKEIQ